MCAWHSDFGGLATASHHTVFLPAMTEQPLETQWWTDAYIGWYVVAF